MAMPYCYNATRRRHRAARFQGAQRPTEGVGPLVGVGPPAVERGAGAGGLPGCGAPLGGTVGGVFSPTTICSLKPHKMLLGSAIWLRAVIASTVVSNRRAMADRVSPGWIVYATTVPGARVGVAVGGVPPGLAASCGPGVPPISTTV